MEKRCRSPQALDQRFAELLEMSNSADWKCVTSLYDVTISERVHVGASGSCLKGAGRIQSRPEEVFATIWDVTGRPSWDKFVEEASLVRQYGQNTQLILLIHFASPLN